MIELRTLGAIDLRNGAGERIDSVLLHTKRLSLLAYLCTSHPVQVQRRDTLVALLWPELDAAHARGALRHELAQLRRALGGDALRGTGAEAVGVNAEQIWCDACAFEAALEADRPADALKLWRGEFLPGLHVPGGEFDRWVDGTRDRLAKRAMEAADRLRLRAEERGDLAAVVCWARCRAELAPYDEPAWHGLLAALDRAGDRAGALAAYNALVTRLRDELDVDPAPETRALADRIRGRMVAQPTVADSSGPANYGGDARELRPDALDPAVDPAVAPAVIAVRPVENLTGDARHDALAQRLGDRLMQGLAQIDFVELSADDDVAAARATVSATLHSRLEQVEVRTRFVAREGARVLAVSEPVLLDPGADDEGLAAVVARVLAAVAAQYHPNVAKALASGRPFVTPSWQALLEFIQGGEAFGASRFEEAARRLRRCYDIDPGFLTGAIFAAIALAYAGDPAGADALATAAMNDVVSATEFERLFGEWFLAGLHGRRPEAYRAAAETLRLSSHGAMRGVAGREALRLNRPAEALRHFMGMDPHLGRGWWRNWTEGYEYIGGALHCLGDHQAELDRVLAGRKHFPESLEVIRAEVRARAALGEPVGALALVEEALTLPSALVSPADVAWTAAQELDTHGDAGTAARLAGLAWLAQRDAPSQSDRLLRVRLLLETGDLKAAKKQLAALGPSEDLEALGLAGLLAAHTGETNTACQLLAQLKDLRNPYLSGRHLLLAAGICVALDRPELALDTLRRALAAGLPFSVELHALPMLRPLSTRADFVALLRPRG